MYGVQDKSCNMLSLSIYLVFSWLLCASTLAKELKIMFWVDPVQRDIYDDVAYTLKAIETLNLKAEIRDTVLELAAADTQVNFEKFCEMLSMDSISIIIDFTYQRWQQGLDFVTHQQIPYLHVDRILSPFMQMFGEFLQQKNANDVVIILQNEQDNLEALHQIVEGYPLRTLLINAENGTMLIRRLKGLRPSPSYYGIFARGANMNNIFETISKGKLLARPPEWHFVFLDTRDRVFKYKKQVQFATKFTINSKDLCKALHMKDAYCVSGFTFQRAMLLEIFRSLIDVRQNRLDSLQPMQVQCNDSGPEQSVLSQSFDLVDHFKLSNFMLYSSSNSGAERLDSMLSLTFALNASINTISNEHDAATELAAWQYGTLRKINESISPAKRFFRIGTVEAMPWSYMRRDARTGKVALDRNGNPIWEGFCIDFIGTLAEKLNFDFELVPPTAGTFGKRNPETGQWDGVVGDLVRGETDIAVAALKMYSDREEVIDFVAPYFEQTGISIVMRKPVRQSSLFKFMTVLRLEVWLSIIAALVVTAIMIWLLDKYSPYSSQNNKAAYPYPTREFTLRESFWFALTSFTPQGGGEAPKSISGRILVAAYWLFVVLMLATFTANLAAFLTVERMQTPVQSLEQLARQSRINYTVVKESDVHQYFINMKFAEDTLYRMWKELALNASADYHKYRIWDYPIKEQYGHILLAINASEPVRDAAEGFRKVNNHENADFAFIHDSSEIKYELLHNCNLTEVGEVFAEQPYAIAVQQGSHLTDEISFITLELQKDRYFEELKDKYWNQSLLKECPMSEDQEGITLESLGGVFIATLFGLGTALVILVFEVLYYKRKQAKVNQVIKVKPVDTTTMSLPKAKAWHTNAASDAILSNVTPPPSFEAATFRGNKIPPGITLGDGEFKPKKLGLQPRRKFRATDQKKDNIPMRDTDLPPYVE